MSDVKTLLLKREEGSIFEEGLADYIDRGYQIGDIGLDGGYFYAILIKDNVREELLHSMNELQDLFKPLENCVEKPVEEALELGKSFLNMYKEVDSSICDDFYSCDRKIDVNGDKYCLGCEKGRFCDGLQTL